MTHPDTNSAVVTRNDDSTPRPPHADGPHIWFLGNAYPIEEDDQGCFITYPTEWGGAKQFSVHECVICEKYVLGGEDVRHLDASLCDDCANAVMNLKHHKHSGRYITWPNEEPERNRRPNRQPISARRRREVHERDHYACRYCGARQKLVLDHIHPWSRGGTNAVENLATACEPCNVHKFDRTPEEAGMTLHDPEHFA